MLLRQDIINKDLDLGDYKLKNFINLSDDEIEMIRRWRNSENIRKWMYSEHLISKDEHRKFINSLKTSTDRAYWLVMKDNEYIGVIYFTNIKWDHRNAYFGIYANPEKKIPGVGRILDSLAKNIAFDILNLHTLKLEVIEDNKVVINLHKKFGFKEEGRLKDFVYKNGKWKDVIIMGIINPKEK